MIAHPRFLKERLGCFLGLEGASRMYKCLGLVARRRRRPALRGMSALLQSFPEAIPDDMEVFLIGEAAPHVIEIEGDGTGLAIRPNDGFVDLNSFETCIINRHGGGAVVCLVGLIAAVVALNRFHNGIHLPPPIRSISPVYDAPDHGFTYDRTGILQRLIKTRRGKIRTGSERPVAVVRNFDMSGP